MDLTRTYCLCTCMWMDMRKKRGISFVLCSKELPKFHNSPIQYFPDDWLPSEYNIFSLVLWSLFFQYDARATTYIELCKLSLKNYTRINLFKTKKSKIVVSKKNIKIEWTLFSPPLNILRNYIYFQACIT